MSNTCIKIQVTGKVQGVFFRKYTKSKANELGLSGWVRNEPDGSVSILACGDEVRLNELVDWCHTGSPGSEVEKVITRKADEVPTDTEFKILR